VSACNVLQHVRWQRPGGASSPVGTACLLVYSKTNIVKQKPYNAGLNEQTSKESSESPARQG
jgi:hypothetical protein